jgi:hypothetical protein
LDDFDLRSQAEADPEAVVARVPALVLDRAAEIKLKHDRKFFL